MYTPIIAGCACSQDFITKIRKDFILIHSPPRPSADSSLIKIHKQAENWLLYFAQKNILMVPGNLRAGLQNFEGVEVNDVSQHCTYTMQHDPTSLLYELKKLLSFAYRRGLFVSKGFDEADNFAVALFSRICYLKSLSQSLLTLCGGVLSHVSFPCVW
jgi:hypothetical protein